MNFGSLASRLAKMATENSPAILTALGVTGTIGTAYLAAKAAFNSALIIDRFEKDLQEVQVDDEAMSTFDTREKIKLVWKEFIPAAGVAALTVAAIVGSHRIGARRAAAIASAYAVAEKGLEEYKKKVAEKVTAQKQQEIREEIAQKHVDEHPRTKRDLRDEKLRGAQKNCYDMYSDRRFFGDMVSIDKAINELNQQILHDGVATLSDFYRLIDLPPVEWSDQVGWRTIVEHTITTTIDNDEPVFALVLLNRPTAENLNVH